jgi:transposase
MSEAIRFGVDLAKSVFQVHGVAADGAVVVGKQLRRGQMLTFFARQPPALIGMEACGSAHYWARELTKLGHEVKLMPPVYVKPYVKRGKNDARDAEAICEAVGRPTMRFVPIKAVEQQCDLAIHKVRDLLIRQRTQLGNAVRGLLYEVGVTAAKGESGLEMLLRRVEQHDAAIPEAMRAAVMPMVEQFRAIDKRTDQLDKQITRAARADPAMRRLMSAPGVGPISAHALVSKIGDGSQFACGRDLAAWIGLTRLNHNTGGRDSRTGHISRAGDKALRRLLVLGAVSWLRQVQVEPRKGSAWITGVMGRRPAKVAAVAQAAKTARILWAMLRSGQDYRAPAAV